MVSIDRFRKHVWWVGGNALSYRPVLQAALIKRSEKMIDVLASVSKSAISPVSQNTYDKAFFRLLVTDAAGNKAYTRAYRRSELLDELTKTEV